MPHALLKSAPESSAVRRGASRATDPRRAAQELFDAIAQPDMRLAVFFCSKNYDRTALASALAAHFTDVPLIGATTAGEITPEGYDDGSITGFSLAGPDFAAACLPLENLAEFSLRAGEAIAPALIAQLTETGLNPSGDNTFAFLLIDGKSMREEMVANALHQGLQDIPLFGGSAGAGRKNTTEKAYVYYDGEFRSNRAVVTLIHTRRPFMVFKTENYVPTERTFVITESDPATRRVMEINGAPAVEELASLIGIDAQQLDQPTLAKNRVGVYTGGSFYLRSIGWINEDKSLRFACAIDRGVVLHFARSVDLVKNLKDQFDKVRAQIGEPELVIGCDCLHRFYEFDGQGLTAQVNDLVCANNVSGFVSYGEQLNSMHINHTMTGVAIGRAQRR